MTKKERKLRKALAFYANPANWDERGVCCTKFDDGSGVAFILDEGATAQWALQEVSEL